jgi:type I restriction enzyme S subunit
MTSTDWQETTLGYVVRFGNGKTRPKTDGEYPIYGGNGILGYSDQFNYDGKTVVIGRVGAYCGATYYEENPIWVSDNALAVKSSDSNDIKYIYYLLKDLNLNQHAEGSSHPLITQNLLNAIEITLPPLPEQRAIAEVLSSLDDKIDLLHRQNQTLEALAETLFRQWFIEEANPTWEEKPLDEVADIFIGRTPPRQEFHWFSSNKNDIKWMSIKDLGGEGVFLSNTSECLTVEAIKKFKIPIIPKNTVVLSFKMTVGRVAITSEDMVSNEAIAQFRLKKEMGLCKEFIYFFLKLFPYEVLGSTSSIVTSINSAMIKSLLVQIPNYNIMVDFQNKVCPMFEKIRENQQQIQKLEKTRDELLPKLMNGDVRARY